MTLTAASCFSGIGAPELGGPQFDWKFCAEIAPTLDSHFGDKQGLEDQHINGGGDCLLPPVSMCLNHGAQQRLDPTFETLIPVNRCDFDEEAVIFKPSHFTRGKDGAPSPISPPLSADADKGDQDALVLVPVEPFVMMERGRDGGSNLEYRQDGTDDLSPTLRSMSHSESHANGGGQVAVVANWQVRRLTPTECERLQGFPDGFTNVEYRGKPAADGPRYKSLGNSMAVPCVAWIMARIEKGLLNG
jgi:C-5 cytosine-specific DNA methylase